MSGLAPLDPTYAAGRHGPISVAASHPCREEWSTSRAGPPDIYRNPVARGWWPSHGSGRGRARRPTSASRERQRGCTVGR